MCYYIYKFIKVLLLSVIFSTVIIIIQKIKNKIKIDKEIPKVNHVEKIKTIKRVKDVLFINGCDPNFLPHPYRYRVLHQMEQLNAGFLESDEYFYTSFEPIMIKNYRVIIFFRCPWTNNVEQAIILAKNLNKKVLFDIDDLVIDKKYTDKIPFINTLSPKEKELHNK